jgi:hypothetical protein
MEAHSKRLYGKGQHRKGGKSPARAVKPERFIDVFILPQGLIKCTVINIILYIRV